MIDLSTSATAPAPAGGRAPFPIVGIGSSAGGLTAVIRLLQGLGGDPGVALVLVSHLDPTHESSLVEILSRVTSMPVQTAVDGDLVQPNRLYVMPPNSELLLSGTALRLLPRPPGPGPHLPIDRFFHALGEDQGPQAVGVVLSGTGSDGARGILTIKAEGGITFAQDDTAEHDQMPRSAVATGAIDFVDHPEGIAKDLVELGERARARGAQQASTDEDGPLARILLAVRRASGIDFSQYKRTTLLRRMQRRAFVHRLGSLREYAELVARDAKEAATLSEEVLIHVTSFFRDPATFDVLRKDVFPRLLAERRGDPPIRLWVPGCSTGEEVYSLAIALLEFLAEAGAEQVPIRVFGTDISNQAIERARAGSYPENIAQEVSAQRLSRFFVKTEERYQILKEVRDQCIFATQDVSRDPPFSNLDLISCRNVMIYLDAALQQRVIPLFHYGLRELGFLVLGSAEGIGSFPGFAVLDARQRIFQRVHHAGRPPIDFGGRLWTPAPQPWVRPTERASSATEVRRSADSAVLAELAPVGVIVNDELTILEFRGQTWPYVEATPGVASLELLRMVREDLRLELRRSIDEARVTGKTVRRAGVLTVPEDAPRAVEVRVVPFSVPLAKARFFVVLFQEQPAAAPASAEAGASQPARESVEAELRGELTSTRDYLQSVIERLEASNEELRAVSEETISSNEELHSTNEEFQTAKEELQATNEELRTINDEMLERNATTARLADDLANILEGVAIPVVILGRDLRIRRFTPAAARLFSLIGADVGRPITDIKPKLQAPELPAMIEKVLRCLGPLEQAVKGDDGRWYHLTVRPYLTADHRVDGAVISVFDVDALKTAELQLTEARDYAQGIVDTVSERLVVLDGDLRVRSANRAFYETFGLAPGDVEKRAFFELDGGAWDLAELRQPLRDLAQGGQPVEVRIERDTPRFGRRAYLLRGRRIGRTAWLLLALDEAAPATRPEV